MRTQLLRKRWAGAAVGLVIMLLLAGCFGGSTSPRLAVDNGFLDFGPDSDVESFEIRNSGRGRLTWEVSGDSDWLSIAPTSGENNGTVTVTVDRNGMASGEYEANLVVTSNNGSATVKVRMEVAAIPPDDKAPGQVHGLDARGFTLPVGVAPLSASVHNASAEARAWLDLVKEFEFAPRSFSSFGAESVAVGPVAHAPMPAGYTGAFVLSWDAVEDATAYRIFSDFGSGYTSQDISAYDLEDPTTPTFMLTGNYAVGTTANFVVQALNGTKVGPASDVDGAVIIAPQTLSSPASGSSTTVQNPQFVWNAHADATGYIVYLATGNRFNHFWTQVVDADTTTQTYPGDDPGVGERLHAGEYLWFVATQGPTSGEPGREQADAYAISHAWAFTVRE